MKYDQQIAPVACSLLPEPHKHALPLPIHPYALSALCGGRYASVYSSKHLYQL